METIEQDIRRAFVSSCRFLVRRCMSSVIGMYEVEGRVASVSHTSNGQFIVLHMVKYRGALCDEFMKSSYS